VFGLEWLCACDIRDLSHCCLRLLDLFDFSLCLRLECVWIGMTDSGNWFGFLGIVYLDVGEFDLIFDLFELITFFKKNYLFYLF